VSKVQQTLQLHSADNVVIALEDGLAEGTAVGHKIALRSIAAGDSIIKYGQLIGTATVAIESGEHVHVHNMSADVGDRQPAAMTATGAAAHSSQQRTFSGIRRANGATGTRNYIGIISTVNCSATVVRQIVARFSPETLQQFTNVDGLCPITHSSGCGMSGSGEGIDLLRRTLGGYIKHPNMGAVLIVGLGCEVNDISSLLRALNIEESDTVRTLAIQDTGGTRSAIDKAASIVEELLAIANRAERSAAPVSALSLALQCGGSDSFSGVTANPALGYAADMLVAAGGTVILGETPEIYGAEHLLLSRAASPAVAKALQDRLDWWQAYVAANGASLNNNPSPGNIAGGISTILEKSLGAVMKSGTTPLQGVCNYAEPIKQPGFVFMDSPGYDPCSITGEIASGANMVCFTTGRGSVFGAKPVPSLKLATNSAMAARMAEDIDYDCGGILTGDKTLALAGEDIFNLIVATASGSKSASELNGLGDFEFVPWQIGAVL
jgi:altronate hydrolase